MSTAHITIDPDGTNNLSLDGSPAAPVRGTGKTAQNVAMEQIRAHAARTQQTVALHVQDTDNSTFDLRIAPDGQVWTAPPAQTEPASTPDSVPTWEQDDTPITVPRVDQTAPPVVTEVPSAQDARDPDREVTRPRHVANPSPEPTYRQHREAQTETHGNWSDHREYEDAAPAEPARTASNDYLPDDPRWADIARKPAEQGFRGTLNGMGLKLAPAEEELAQRRESFLQDLAREAKEREAAQEEARAAADQQTRRAARAREDEQRDKEQRAIIQTNFWDCKTVTAANPKGGAHKTTVMALLAAMCGRIRGGGVIAWDANETMGTLGDRTMEDLHSNTVVDLLEKSADDFTSVETSRLGTIDKYVRQQGDNHFNVLASDEDPERQDMVDGDGFRTVHQILERFNRMIFVDTGNNARAEHFLAAMEATDQLVIPVSAGLDSALVAEKMMKALTARGHGGLVQNAVVMLHDSESRKIDDTDTARRFEDKVGAVIPIPFDAALKDGGKIDYDALQPATRRAYQEAAAAIAQNLRTQIKGREA